MGGADSIDDDLDKDYSGSGSGFRGKSFISQRDPSIANKKFGNETIGEAGCAPVSAYMAAGGGLNEAVGIAKKYQNSNGVSSDYFREYFNKQGLDSSYSSSSQDIKSNLRNGNKVVLGGNDFTNTSKVCLSIKN